MKLTRFIVVVRQVVLSVISIQIWLVKRILYLLTTLILKWRLNEKRGGQPERDIEPPACVPGGWFLFGDENFALPGSPKEQQRDLTVFVSAK